MSRAAAPPVPAATAVADVVVHENPMIDAGLRRRTGSAGSFQHHMPPQGGPDFVGGDGLLSPHVLAGAQEKKGGSKHGKLDMDESYEARRGRNAAQRKHNIDEVECVLDDLRRVHRSGGDAAFAVEAMVQELNAVGDGMYHETVLKSVGVVAWDRFPAKDEVEVGARGRIVLTKMVRTDLENPGRPLRRLYLYSEGSSRETVCEDHFQEHDQNQMLLCCGMVVCDSKGNGCLGCCNECCAMKVKKTAAFGYRAVREGTAVFDVICVEDQLVHAYCEQFETATVTRSSGATTQVQRQAPAPPECCKCAPSCCSCIKLEVGACGLHTEESAARIDFSLSVKKQDTVASLTERDFSNADSALEVPLHDVVNKSQWAAHRKVYNTITIRYQDPRDMSIRETTAVCAPEEPMAKLAGLTHLMTAPPTLVITGTAEITRSVLFGAGGKKGGKGGDVAVPVASAMGRTSKRSLWEKLTGKATEDAGGAAEAGREDDQPPSSKWCFLCDKVPQQSTNVVAVAILVLFICTCIAVFGGKLREFVCRCICRWVSWEPRQIRALLHAQRPRELLL